MGTYRGIFYRLRGSRLSNMPKNRFRRKEKTSPGSCGNHNARAWHKKGPPYLCRRFDGPRLVPNAYFPTTPKQGCAEGIPKRAVPNQQAPKFVGSRAISAPFASVCSSTFSPDACCTFRARPQAPDRYSPVSCDGSSDTLSSVRPSTAQPPPLSRCSSANLVGAHPALPKNPSCSRRASLAIKGMR